jgi:hypothetical protein
METSSDATMPHPVPTKIIGKPTEKTITILHTQLIANARSIHSDGGDGLLGHARIVLTEAQYINASHNNVAYAQPAKPAPVIHAINATADTMYRSDKTYDLALKVWKLHKNTENKIMQQLLASVDDKYTKTLKEELFLYSNTNPLAVIQHLQRTYGQITAEDLLANREQLKAPWHPEDEMENFFHNIENCVAYAAKGADPISTRNAVETGVATLKKTGQYGYAIREWNREDLVNQTYDSFKLFFTDAEKERQADATMATTGFQRANQAGYIPTDDNATITTTASTLTTLTMADIQATIQAGIQTGIQAALAAHTAGNNNTNPVPPPIPPRQPNRLNSYSTSIEGLTAAELATMGYCWSHGFCHTTSHTSATCFRPNEGHQLAATGTNRMGGCNERYQPPNRTRPNNRRNNN